MGENLLVKGRQAVDAFFIKEHAFKTKGQALEKAMEMKKKYGYRPRIFSFEGESKHVVVEPRNLKKI